MNGDRQSPPFTVHEVPMNRVTIKELRLRNYRAFVDARLDLDDVTFLVGRNGAGKSTLMDAFGFVSEAVTDSLGTALERRGGLESIRRRQHGAGAPSDLSVAVGFELEHYGRNMPVVYGFTLGKELTGPSSMIKQEVLRSTDAALWGGDVTRFDRTQNEFQCARRDLHPVLDPNTLVLSLIAGSSDSWKLIAEALKRVSIHQLSPGAIRSEPKIGRDERLSRDGHNAGDVLKYLKPKDKKWIETWLAATVPGFKDVSTRAVVGRRVIMFAQEGDAGHVERFDASQMSDGTLRSLGVLLALRQSPKPSIVLLDEIEDSLHPLAHGVLLDAIDEAGDEFPVVVSTHSPEILNQARRHLHTSRC
jgi:predicted ATPase